VKLKRQATAAFLGVFAFPRDVVAVCCIPTTILAGFHGRAPDFAGRKGFEATVMDLKLSNPARRPDWLLLNA
jgi:hypothetical protein